MQAVQPADIDILCQMYGLDSVQVSMEVNEFRKVYCDTEAEIDISDLINVNSRHSKTKERKRKSEEEENEDDEEDNGDRVNDPMSDEDDEEANWDCEKQNITLWLSRGFLKPFRLIVQLSSFSHLRALYKILLTLPVTSCSAERSLSKHKLIKNHLRSTMLDPYMSSMLILALERDLLVNIKNDTIIDRLATKSKRLASLLIN